MVDRPVSTRCLEGRIDRLGEKIEDLGRALRDHPRTFVVTVVGAMTAVTAIFGVVVGLVA